MTTTLNVIFECLMGFICGALATSLVALLIHWMEQRKLAVTRNLEALAAKARSNAVLEFELALERARAGTIHEVQVELDSAEWESERG